MASKRGLGLAKSSIFTKTTKETIEVPEVKKKEKIVATPSENNEEWKVCTLQFKPEHKKLLDNIAYYDRKDKRDVLAEIFEFYKKKKKL